MTYKKLILDAAQAEEIFSLDELERGCEKVEYDPAFNSRMLELMKHPERATKVLAQGQAHDLIYQQDYVYRLWVRRGPDGNYMEVEKYTDGAGWHPHMYYNKQLHGKRY